MKLLVFLTLALMSAACSDDPKSDALDCKALAEADCIAEPLCTAFYGTKVDVAAACYGPHEMITCGTPIEIGDNNTPSGYVVDPDGTCWFQDSAYFGDEPGFRTERILPSVCAPVTGACEPVNCAVRGEADCVGQPFCQAIYGSKLDETTMCYGPTEMIICGDFASDCPNNVVGHLRDADGNCWSQAHACYNIGHGYVPADDENPCPFDEPAECRE